MTNTIETETTVLVSELSLLLFNGYLLMGKIDGDRLVEALELRIQQAKVDGKSGFLYECAPIGLLASLRDLPLPPGVAATGTLIATMLPGERDRLVHAFNKGLANRSKIARANGAIKVASVMPGKIQ